MNQARLLLKKIEERTTRNGDPFLILTFQDLNQETIIGKVWEVHKADFPHQIGLVYDVAYTTEEFNGQTELANMELTPTEDSPLLFAKAAKKSEEEIKSYIYKIVEKITYEPFKKLLSEMLDTQFLGNTFWTHPAAKRMHGAYVRGLSYHTYCMLKTAQGIIDAGIYEGVNADLVYTTIILHDVGKIYELSGPMDTQYTVIGNLIGHISIMDGLVVEFMNKNNIYLLEPYFMNLRHCLLAHHGEREYGSPVTPKTMEAMLVHQIDLMDSRMAMFEEGLEKVDIGEMSSHIQALGGPIHNHGLN